MNLKTTLPEAVALYCRETGQSMDDVLDALSDGVGPLSTDAPVIMKRVEQIRRIGVN